MSRVHNRTGVHRKTAKVIDELLGNISAEDLKILNKMYSAMYKDRKDPFRYFLLLKYGKRYPSYTHSFLKEELNSLSREISDLLKGENKELIEKTIELRFENLLKDPSENACWTWIKNNLVAIIALVVSIVVAIFK